MLIYSICVFLNEENLNKVVEDCKQKGYKIKISEEQDQTGEKATVYCTEIKRLKFVFTKCNDFHKDHDFEIGLTLENKQKALNFFEGLDSSLYESGIYGDNCMYGIPLAEEYHGPFFFNYDRNIFSSVKEVKSIKATILSYDFDFYNTHIKPLLDEELQSKFDFTVGESFYLNDIVFIEPIEKFLTPEGKIRDWPNTAEDKQLVMEYLASKFEKDRIYKEKEVNEIINNYHDFMNITMLRRELIARKLLCRKDDCTAYWKE